MPIAYGVTICSQSSGTGLVSLGVRKRTDCVYSIIRQALRIFIPGLSTFVLIPVLVQVEGLRMKVMKMLKLLPYLAFAHHFIELGKP